MYPYYRGGHIGSHSNIFLSLISEFGGGYLFVCLFFSEAQIKYNCSPYSGVLNHE